MNKDRNLIIGLMLLCGVMLGTYIGARRLDAQSAAIQQQSKQLAHDRNWVIPQEVIDSYQMHAVDPKTFGQWVVGEDDKTYGLDETLRVLFVIGKDHWRATELKRELAAPNQRK